MNLTYKLTLAILPLLFLSCKRDSDPGGCKNSNAIVRVHDFNPAYYSRIMIYKDADSVRFLKNGNDTVVFYAGPIRNIDEIIPAQSGCGKENFKAVMQILNSPTEDTLLLFYSMMLNYNFDYDQFAISFSETDFSQFPQYIVNCDTGTSSITVLGKSYCVGKMGVDQPGYPIILYAKDIGIIKISVNNNVYELIPK